MAIPFLTSFYVTRKELWVTSLYIYGRPFRVISGKGVRVTIRTWLVLKSTLKENSSKWHIFLKEVIYMNDNLFFVTARCHC